jgi:alpha-D-xyloside xylohydrolase
MPRPCAGLWLFISLGWLGCQSPPGPQVALSRGETRLIFDPADLSLQLERGSSRLLRFARAGLSLGLVDQVKGSLNYDPWPLVAEDGAFPSSDDSLVWESPQAATVEEATDSTLRLRLEFPQAVARLSIEQSASESYRLKLVPEQGGERVAYFRLTPEIDAGEGLYGLGGVSDHVNHRGTRRAMQIELQAEVDSGYNDMHVPIPFAIGTKGWGLFVESRHPGAWDMAASQPDRIAALVGTGPDSRQGLSFHLFSAAHPLDVTKKYYEVTGFPGLPARWALGPWLWRDDHVTQAQILADCASLRDLDLANNGIWADRPYSTGISTFDFDKKTFPDPAAMLRTVRELGFAFALWHSPYIDDSDPATATLSQEAKAGGFYPPQVGILFTKWGQPIDFSNPAASAWWQRNLQRYSDAGVVGYKLDYGEDVQIGLPGGRNVWRFFDGSDERTGQATFKLGYHRVFFETLPRDGGFLLCRVGTYGGQRYGCVIWPGDMDANMARYGERRRERSGKEYVSIGGLPATVIYGLSLGPSGYPFYGADTGGYRHAPPDKETFVRWFEQTALSSVMQVGTGSDNVPWETPPDTDFDAQVLALYRVYARLHLRLWPYEWTLAQRIAADGRPIQRPLGLAYPELGEHPDDVYLFGDDLLVAPVVDHGAREKRVIVPPGRWVDWWQGSSLKGPGAHLVPAPLGVLPLYVREGAIVPLLRPTIDTLLPTTQPDRVDSYATTPGLLYPRVVPGPASTFALFDGSELGQEDGAETLTLRSRSGREFQLGALFEVLAWGARAPQAVRIGARSLDEKASLSELEKAESGWLFEAVRGGTLYVKVPAGEQRVDVQK